MAEWIISSAVLIAVVIVLRFALRGRISPRLQYALWGLVLLRLLVPVSFGSAAISVGNLTRKAAESQPVQAITAVTELEVPAIRYQWTDSGNTAPTAPVENNAAQTPAKESLTVAEIARLVWLCGIAVVGVWFVLSNLRFGRTLRKSRVLLDNSRTLPVYVSGAVDTPCLFGLLRPAVYLTPEAAEDKAVTRHAVEHELTHYRHGDNLWALLRCVCLAVHWFDPLVWWAAVLSRGDGELACDEATIRCLGENERADYGRTLIRLTCEKRPALLNTATTMTGSGKSIRTRIALIVKKPKMAAYTAVAVVLIAALAVGCTFTGANEPEQGADGMTVYDCGGLSAAIPNEYADELIVYAGAETGEENVLLKVYGRAATEAFAAADLGENDDMGWLFSLVRWDQARYEEYLGEDGSGINVFAQDDTWYYVCVQPTDVTFYPTGDAADQERWVEVLSATLAAEVRADFVTRNDTLTGMLTPENAVAELFGTDNEGTLTLYLPNGGKQATYDAPGSYYQENIQAAIRGYAWTWLDAPPTEPAEYWLTLESADGTRKLTFYANSGAGMVEYESGGKSVYWSAEPVADGAVSVADDVRSFYALVSDTYYPDLAGGGADDEDTMAELLAVAYQAALTHDLDVELSQGQILLWGDTEYEVEFPVKNTDTYNTYVTVGVSRATDGSLSVVKVEVLCTDLLEPESESGRADDSQISFRVDGGAEAAAEYFVQSAFGAHRMSLPSGNWYRYTDYALIDWDIDAVGWDDLAVAGWFQYAFVPEVPDTVVTWAGSTDYGTGEYEGMLVSRLEFVLQKQEDGCWHCLDMGTGGNTGVLNSLYDTVQ